MCLCDEVKGKKGWVVSLPRDKEGGNRGKTLGSPKLRKPGRGGELFSGLRRREEKNILLAEGMVCSPQAELH